MTSQQLAFRPFVEVTGIYSTGLATVAVDSAGDLANASGQGVEVVGGISGSHSWKHTQIGLSYRGDYRSYTYSAYNNSDQSLMLGVKHQFTRHVLFDLRESAGMFNRDYGLLGLNQAVPFDPTQSYVPVTDFFDNRTIYATTQADLVFQKSARLSFDFGGDGFLNRRQSTALYGVTGASARGDVQYRLTRRTTIGGNYQYNHFSFTGLFSSTDIHAMRFSFATQLSRWWEFTGFGGASRVETKFIQSVPVDPVITQLIGITEGSEVVYSTRYVPDFSARLSRTFHHGVFFVDGGKTVTPGNGLFLTSSLASAGAGYTYTGLRRWSFNVTAGYQASKSIGNVIGTYGSEMGGTSVSRELGHSFHALAAVNIRKYTSSDFSLYNRAVYETRIGFGWTPGDIPLRIW
jgi:hypothetical protein